MNTLLKVEDLKTSFYRKDGVIKAVQGISYEVKTGESLAIVGESGSGKSVSVSSVMRLIQSPGKIEGGKVIFNGEDLLKVDEKRIRDIRGKEISMVFQDPMSSLNPTKTVGEQIIEPILWHNIASKDKAKEKAIKLLAEVGIPSPEERFKQYPFEFSGGMRQRVMIAMGLICEPKLLIADEPTTALDVTVQAQILSIMKTMQKKLNMSVILITHDLAVASMFSDSVIVMYAGHIVEKAPVSEFIKRPSHPYSIGLLNSTPVLGRKNSKLEAIPGQPPNLKKDIPGCPFAKRCSKKMDKCDKEKPPVSLLTETHSVYCWLYGNKGVNVNE